MSIGMARTAQHAAVGVSMLCVAVHVWATATAPDAMAVLLLALAVACAWCARPHRGIRSIEEWAGMALGALAMLALHLDPPFSGGMHHGGASGAAGLPAAPLAPGAPHALATALAAVELVLALAVLVVRGAVRRRAELVDHHENAEPARR